jgi:hypothetical protein
MTMKNHVVFFAAFLVLSSAATFAALASPATISSITCSAGTCTVTTSAAHNIGSTDPGFCILSSSVTADNICGAASTVPTGTTFTVVSAVMVACASTCGTAQPAPVFMLSSSRAEFGQQLVSACMWAYVTSPVPISGGTSQCSARFSGNLQSEVNAAIAAGSWVEYVVSVGFSNSATVPTIQQYFQALQFSYQLQTVQPGGVSGRMCDVTGCN